MTPNPQQATQTSRRDNQLIAKTLEEIDRLDALYGPGSAPAERLLFTLEGHLQRSLTRRVGF